MRRQSQGQAMRPILRGFAGAALFLMLSIPALRSWTQTQYSPDGVFQEKEGRENFLDLSAASAGSVREEREAIPLPEENHADAPEDWRLLLVNAQHPLPQEFEITLTRLKNGHAVDSRAYPDLQAMMDACRADGLSPLICSSYREQAYQRTLYENKAAEFSAEGMSDAAACAAAAQIVAPPGTSEHQTGLAVDIVDLDYQLLDEAQEDTPVQQWLMENSWRYGFILRYPSAHSGCTGICYEPWHYRYVGLEAAKEIYEQGLCLEEYLESFC